MKSDIDSLENGLQFLIKLDTLLPHGPPTSLLDVSLKEMKNYVYTKTCLQIFIVILFTIAPNRKQLGFCFPLLSRLDEHQGVGPKGFLVLSCISGFSFPCF